MSRFQHNICEPCWNKKHPDRVAHAMVEEFRETERCCFCFCLHQSGISIREDPNNTKCGGDHGEELPT